ncbi:MAG: TOBE domain-containing protein, partial [Pseudomonadota bacterium]
RVALILDGRMKQYDKADVFYKRPVDEATARFFGGQNFVEGVARDGVFEGPLGRLHLPEGVAEGAGKLTFRPENLRLNGDPAAQNTLQATVADKIYLGTQTRLKLRIGGEAVEIVTNPNEVEAVVPGQTLTVTLPPAALWMLRT